MREGRDGASSSGMPDASSPPSSLFFFKALPEKEERRTVDACTGASSENVSQKVPLSDVISLAGGNANLFFAEDRGR